jgi:hypothetical protein
MRSPRLWAKAALIAIALAVSVVHDFVVGPRVAAAGAPAGARVAASWLGRLNALIALAIVWLGLSLR